MKTREYFKNIHDLLNSVSIIDNKGKQVLLDDAFSKITLLIHSLKRKNNKIILIGNGGSASIASHIATDFLKNAGIPALAFNDASLITCVSNDMGYENVFKKPLEMLACKGDVFVSISSSGRSPNILRATQAAKKKPCSIITFSGFDSGNPLRKMGKLNFYIKSNSYGYVEIAHLALCHCILDAIIGKK